MKKKYLTRAVLKSICKRLAQIRGAYPTRKMTEKHLEPAFLALLRERLSCGVNVQQAVQLGKPKKSKRRKSKRRKGGRVPQWDFLTKGSNHAALEFAVHRKGGAANPSQNKSELKKLLFGTADGYVCGIRTRYLVILDIRTKGSALIPRKWEAAFSSKVSLVRKGYPGRKSFPIKVWIVDRSGAISMQFGY